MPVEAQPKKVELSLKELKPWVQGLVETFQAKQLILLSGPLGAGKTEFVKIVLQTLGSEETSSPTYGLIHEYEVAKRKNVYHIDLYRIEGEEDLESSGFWDLFDNEDGLIFVEWADKAQASDFPQHWPTLHTKIEKSADDNHRAYSVSSNPF